MPAPSEVKAKAQKPKDHNCAYIVRCADGTLYTGWTNDLARRVQAHNGGTGAKYTRSRLPVQLVYFEEYEDRGEARRREYAIKQLSRREKERLIGGGRLYFTYGDRETEYLKRKDKRLGAAIDAIGHIEREIDGDLFSSVIHHIAGQQISSAALKTVWARLTDKLGPVSAETVRAASREEIQACGLTFRKADYIKDFAAKVQSGEFDVEALRSMPDAEVISRLSALKGVGVWTAEMLMIFCLERPDIMSYGDLAIRRGLCALYHHRKIDRRLFDKYARRYSPCGTVASLYLWAIAGGALNPRSGNENGTAN
jgi:DNA-3-methyladenine glycosylase II